MNRKINVDINRLMSKVMSEQQSNVCDADEEVLTGISSKSTKSNKIQQNPTKNSTKIH
jgi:hypothetical protein